MQIYLARNQVQAGPYTLEQLNNMLATQQVLLDDLMWHEGLSQWQRVGTLTNETYYYNPNNSVLQDNSKISVARLYGEQELLPQNNEQTKNNNSTFSQKSTIFKKTQAATTAATNEVAGIARRVLAVLLNFFLLSVCLVPISSNFSQQQILQLQSASTEESQLLILTELYNSVPQHLAILSAVLIIALIFIQVVLLIKKGQSIGKLVTGIRILDFHSQKLPTANTILLRTIITVFIYYLTPIGAIAVIADLIAMLFDKENRSLHDRLAKTFVVKANDEQLKMTNQR